MRSSSSFGWNVGNGLPHGAVITRSFDGTAYVAVIGKDGCGSWGNGWPHCTHLTGSVMASANGGEINLLFFMGSLPELLREIRG